MSPDQHITEMQKAIGYLLNRMVTHAELSYHMLGTESYRRLVCAFAESHGQLEALGEMPEMLPAYEVLTRIEHS